MNKKPVPSQKAWYTSKTMRAAVVAAVALLIKRITGYEIDPEMQGAILILLFVFLRTITKQSVTWSKIDVDPEDVLEPEK